MCVCTRARVRACVCVCVCVPLASDASETIEVIIVKLGLVTALDMRMHHTGLNHEDNKCSIISETIQAMPIKYDVKIARLKIYNDHYQSDDLTFTGR